MESRDPQERRQDSADGEEREDVLERATLEKHYAVEP